MKLLKIYGFIFSNPKLACKIPTPSSLEDDVIDKLMDNICVLRQIEIGINHSTVKVNDISAWKTLSPDQNELKKYAENASAIIMKIQLSLMERYHKNGTISTHNLLFWALIGYY
jgi:hypothetical protein